LKISWGRIIAVTVSVAIVVIGAFAAWTFDGRTDVVITPEIEAQIADMESQAAANPADATVIANDIANLINQARATAAVVTNGVSPDGAQLGLWSMVLAGIALLTTLPGVGIAGHEDHRKWLWSSVTAGLGTGIAAIAFAWIFTFVRSGDANFVSGVGSFLSMMGGLFILASTMPVLREFRRSKVYDDEPSTSDSVSAEEPVEELV
jgi:hypothetical protein